MKPLSCDNPQDAVRSLSVIHGVDRSNIERAIDHPPDFLSGNEYEETIQNLWFPTLMGRHVSGNLSDDLGEIAYYHRARYDGSDSWFSSGLLCSNEGAEAFLEKTRHLYAGYDFKKIKNKCLANIRTRAACEGKSSANGGGGPYAFDIFDHAKCGHGERFDTPEMFLGPQWRGWCSEREAATDLIEILKKNLKPAIVKFIGRTNSPEHYTALLWDYLYKIRNNPECTPFTHTFTGGGKNIPKSQIISIIDL